MPKSLRENADEIRIAALFAKAAYGEGETGTHRNTDDDGVDDSYEDYLRGLTEADLPGAGPAGGAEWSVLPLEWIDSGFVARGVAEDIQPEGGLFHARGSRVAGTAEALVGIAEVDGARIVVYAARGTGDEDQFAAAIGQTYTARGQREHYALHQPWIDATLRYVNDPDNAVDAFIFAGHSMGGGIVDQFSAKDSRAVAERIELTMVAIASAGVHPDRLAELGGRFENLDAYIGLSHSQDPVTFPNQRFHLNSSTLRGHVHPEEHVTVIDLPKVDGRIRTFGPFFGEEHGRGRYHANIGEIARDPALRSVAEDNPRIVMGDDGDELGGDRLNGTGGRDYILGLRGDDAVFAGDGDDTISGGDGDDRLSGGDGSDIIHPGAGSNLVSGGGGGDTVRFENRDWSRDVAGTVSEALSVDLAAGRAVTELYRADGSTNARRADTLEGVESVGGTRFADRLLGDGGVNVLQGLGGDDVIRGRGGRDVLEGGDGDDHLDGGGGGDVLSGGAGDDTLVGGAGADRMEGGAGSDLYLLDHAGDVVVEARDSAGIDTARTSVDHRIAAGVERLEAASGAGGLRLDGSARPETLVGNGSGNVLVGFGGADTLEGGAGADVFVINRSGGAEPDVTVLDFRPEDTLAVDDRLLGIGTGRFDPRALTGDVVRDLLAAGTARYDAGAGILSVDLDGGGPGGLVAVASLGPDTRLGLDDILLF